MTRKGDKAIVHLSDGTEQAFDKVIFASHANETLAMLGEPTADEQRLLSPFKYEKNPATVNTDESVMPKNKKTWSSWNYRIEERTDKKFQPLSIG